MIGVSLLLALIGLAAMGCSQAAHHRWAFGYASDGRRRIGLRWGGLVVALSSLVPSMIAWGPAFGSVGWFGILSLAAFALLLARTYLPPPSRP